MNTGFVRLLFGLFLLMVWDVEGWSVQAYEAITVKDGGTLTGTLILKGKVPKPKGYNLVTFPDPVYCGRISTGKGWRLLQPFNVGEEGEFRDVVVMVEGIERGKPMFEKTTRIEAVDCLFQPFISIVRNKQPIEVVNLDPVFHDIQAYETSRLGARVLFNSPLPMNPRYSKSGLAAAGRGKRLAGDAISHKVKMHKGRRIFVMQCGFHAYMESWGMVVDHPYVALTDQEGKFSISEIPPGTYTVTVWHPVVKAGRELEYEVTIQPNQNTTLNLEIEAPRGRIYTNQLEDNPRFGLSLMGETKIIPSVELQTY